MAVDVHTETVIDRPVTWPASSTCWKRRSDRAGQVAGVAGRRITNRHPECVLSAWTRPPCASPPAHISGCLRSPASDRRWRVAPDRATDGNAGVGAVLAGRGQCRPWLSTGTPTASCGSRYRLITGCRRSPANAIPPSGEPHAVQRAAHDEQGPTVLDVDTRGWHRASDASGSGHVGYKTTDTGRGAGQRGTGPTP
jgi:hypothetical protein